ncbi:tyrosine-type recombinase/integrase [Pontibacillus salipaludis]|uniref:tyrosine-type recombinase/integrase n=1 Tax=Pontibacillus salipaludis TaxID=1697394 RepID=UPI0031EE53B5
MRKKNRQIATRRRTGVMQRREVGENDSIRPGLTAEIALSKLMMIYETENYREKTMQGYRYHWEEFFRVTGKIFADEVEEEDFRRYISVLLKVRELSPVTVNIRLTSVRAMYKRLKNENIISYNPAERIRKLKTDEQRIFTLNDNQVRRLFAVINMDIYAGFRDYVSMLVMLKCGLRVNEIDSLEVEDIDFENGMLILPGAKNKNRKTRMVPMTEKVQKNLAQLVTETRDYFGADVTHVFTNQFGEPLRYDRIRKRMDSYARKAGLKDEVRASPHSLRHTFAVNYLKNGGDIRSLQMILGHADLATTQRYLDYTDDIVVTKYKEVNMKDNLDV